MVALYFSLSDDVARSLYRMIVGCWENSANEIVKHEPIRFQILACCWIRNWLCQGQGVEALPCWIFQRFYRVIWWGLVFRCGLYVDELHSNFTEINAFVSLDISGTYEYFTFECCADRYFYSVGLSLVAIDFLIIL